MLQMQQIYCYQYSTMPLESQNKFSRSKPGMKRKIIKIEEALLYRMRIMCIRLS